MESIWRELLVVVVGNIVFLVLNMYFVHWRKRAEQPDDLRERVDKLEAAFVSHTGITINGKSYRTGE